MLFIKGKFISKDPDNVVTIFRVVKNRLGEYGIQCIACEDFGGKGAGEQFEWWERGFNSKQEALDSIERFKASIDEESWEVVHTESIRRGDHKY